MYHIQPLTVEYYKLLFQYHPCLYPHSHRLLLRHRRRHRQDYFQSRLQILDPPFQLYLLNCHPHHHRRFQ
jgi:hypothetical protein